MVVRFPSGKCTQVRSKSFIQNYKLKFEGEENNDHFVEILKKSLGNRISSNAVLYCGKYGEIDFGFAAKLLEVIRGSTIKFVAHARLDDHV